MQTTAFECYVIVAALSRLSYEFEDIDPEVSRVAWDPAVAIAGEYGYTPSEVVRLLEWPIIGTLEKIKRASVYGRHSHEALFDVSTMLTIEVHY